MILAAEGFRDAAGVLIHLKNKCCKTALPSYSPSAGLIFTRTVRATALNRIFHEACYCECREWCFFGPNDYLRPEGIPIRFRPEF